MPADDTRLVPRSTALLVSCWLLSATLSMGAVLAWIVIPQFLNVFNSFGTDLPAVTLVVIALRPVWWLLPVPALLLAIRISVSNEFQQAQQTRFTLLAAGWFAISLALVATCIYALYAPIFAMGQIR